MRLPTATGIKARGPTGSKTMQPADLAEVFESIADAPATVRDGVIGDLGSRDRSAAGELRRLLQAHDRARSGGFLGGEAIDRVLADCGAGTADLGLAEATPEPPCPSDFRKRRRLGRGGFGEVWIVENVHTGELQAAKFIPDPDGVELAGISRVRTSVGDMPGLVPIDHVGLVDHWLYATMPLADAADERGLQASIEGYRPLTLSAHAARSVRLPSAEVAAIGAALAGTVAGLHTRGLVHGDIKPDNVLRFSGSWLLGDYSLVRVAGQAGRPMGTPAFLPPEGPGSVAADQYALAVTLFCLLTGRPPGEFAAWRDSAETPDRGAGRLAAALRRAGAPRPVDRFADMGQFGAELVCGGSSSGLGQSSPAARAARPRLRRAQVRVAAALVGIGTLAGAVLFVINTLRGPGASKGLGQREPGPAPAAQLPEGAGSLTSPAASAASDRPVDVEATAGGTELQGELSTGAPDAIEAYVAMWATRPMYLLMGWDTSDGFRWVRSDLRLVPHQAAGLRVEPTGARWPREGTNGWHNRVVPTCVVRDGAIALELPPGEFTVGPNIGSPLGNDRVDWDDLRHEGWNLREYAEHGLRLITAFPPDGAMLYSTLQHERGGWSNRARESSQELWGTERRLPGGRVSFDAAFLANGPSGAIGHLTGDADYALRGRVALNSAQLDRYLDAGRQIPEPTVVRVLFDGVDASLLRLDATAPSMAFDIQVPHGAQSVSFELVQRPPFVDEESLAFLDVRLVN